MCNTDVEPLQHLMEHHISKLEELKRSLRRSIPVYVDERLWLQSNATKIELVPQSFNLELITHILIYISAPSGGTLQLGVDRIIPLPQGITRWDNLLWLLKSTDTRTLTQVTAGAMGLELMGVEQVDRGPF